SRTLTSPLRARAPMPLDKRTALRRRGLLLARAVVAHPCAHAEEGGQREREDQEEQAAGHGDHDRPSAGARSLWGAVRRGWLCHRCPARAGVLPCGDVPPVRGTPPRYPKDASRSEPHVTTR